MIISLSEYEHVVEAVREADRIEYVYDDSLHFLYNEYYFLNDAHKYEVAILTPVCVCFFKKVKDAVINYTLCKKEEELTTFEINLVASVYPFFWEDKDGCDELL